MSSPPGGFRYYAGWFFFILTLGLPVLALIIPSLGLPAATTTVVTGALIVGGPEIAMILAVTFWGRETFAHFTGRLKASVTPPPSVSPTRYRVGLALFLGSALPSWLIAYLPHLLSDSARVPVLASADLIFVARFFVLGGEFWGKLRALFTP
ncbi:MAG: hypothetical protein FJX76_06990 [Armatimonadetes bacterium]|nr:hypothetical protein [Armatimonadota bacterium]